MHKKILSISALSGVAILSLIMALTPSGDVTTFEVNENFSQTLGKYSESIVGQRVPEARPISTQYSSQASDNESARQLTSVNSISPRIFPEEFELKSIFYETRDGGFGDIVTQFYMPNSVDFTSETTFRDVMDKGGFVIIQVNEDPEKITNEWPEKLGDDIPTFTTIKGTSAMILSGDGTKGQDSQIFFYNGNTFVNIVSVSLNSDELLKIANSMS